MLENPALVIGPVIVSPQRAYRTIHDGDPSHVLGHVFRPSHQATVWFEDWRPRSETVCETPDGSLLCEIRRQWWFGETNVLDSEHQLIAILRRKHILGVDGQLLAKRHSSHVASEEIFRTGHGIELASVTKDGETRRMNFHPRISEEPLVKLALLASVLFF